MERSVYDIILNPVITEKSSKTREDRTYVFNVAKEANKNTIKAAIEKIFNVKVERVNVINKKGSSKMTRFRHLKKSPDTKKAYIKLKEGFSIDLFEGM